MDCESLDDVMSLLVSGSAVRHTGSTQMNEHSSRSHSIFTVTVGKHVKSCTCIIILYSNFTFSFNSIH